jgi:hypothetical protein
MKMQEIRRIAKKWGVDARVTRSKKDIIQNIQTKEGNEPCFKTRDVCSEYGCLWRDDCIKT